MTRFEGTVEHIAGVKVRNITEWITSIDLNAWPQQGRIRPNEPRPSMVTDLSWHGFGEVTTPIVEALMWFFPGCTHYQRMLSVVMPGNDIEPHRDEQDAHWNTRVHVPLLTNDEALFIVNGIPYNLKVGGAYKVNTLAEHAVKNNGPTPRIHLMFDIRNKEPHMKNDRITKWRVAHPDTQIEDNALNSLDDFPSLAVNDFCHYLTSRGTDKDVVDFVQSLGRECAWVYDNWTKAQRDSNPRELLSDLINTADTKEHGFTRRFLSDYARANNLG